MSQMRLILLDRALQEYGVTEIPGDKSNPEINKYFDIIDQTWANDEVAWCSAFVNWACKVNGFEYSGELTARSWLGIGDDVTHDPKRGDIVIFWREDPNSWKGHVGFYINEKLNVINCLGGNQNNQVNIVPYPAYRLLKIIRPKFLITNED